MSVPWEDYRVGLDRHLRQADEAARARGYELGRVALARGMSLLDLVEAHGQAVGSLPQPSPGRDLEFLEEALSPFEMALRGYREANQGLAAANLELAEANRKLKEAQAQLVHTAKMASLGTLTAGLAHEINNPLAFCLSHVHSLRSWAGRLRSGDPDADRLWQRAEDRLAEVSHGLERIRDLVVNLRTFSRVDEGEFKIVDVHETIESALLFLSHEMRDRIRIVRDYDPDGTLACFPGPFGQIAMNLLSNAVQALADQGTITVTTRRRPGWFSLSVRDTGVGIPPEQRDRIFEPFFTTRPVGAGTGLGLAIASQLVEAHHGALSVDSTPGQGSLFTAEFPTDLAERLGPRRA